MVILPVYAAILVLLFIYFISKEQDYRLALALSFSSLVSFTIILGIGMFCVLFIGAVILGEIFGVRGSPMETVGSLPAAIKGPVGFLVVFAAYKGAKGINRWVRSLFSRLIETRAAGDQHKIDTKNKN